MNTSVSVPWRPGRDFLLLSSKLAMLVSTSMSSIDRWVRLVACTDLFRGVFLAELVKWLDTPDSAAEAGCLSVLMWTDRCDTQQVKHKASHHETQNSATVQLTTRGRKPTPIFGVRLSERVSCENDSNYRLPIRTCLFQSQISEACDQKKQLCLYTNCVQISRTKTVNFKLWSLRFSFGLFVSSTGFVVNTFDKVFFSACSNLQPQKWMMQQQQHPRQLLQPCLFRSCINSAPIFDTRVFGRRLSLRRYHWQEASYTVSNKSASNVRHLLSN